MFPTISRERAPTTDDAWLRTMPARSLPGRARSASGERIRFDYTDLVVLHPVLHGGRLPKGKGGPPARGRRRVKIFFLLLELSLSGTSTRIKLKTACRSCLERCDRHEVGAFHVSPTHHSLLVSSSSATSATARRSPQEGAEPAFSQAATVFICHPPRFRVSQ